MCNFLNGLCEAGRGMGRVSFPDITTPLFADQKVVHTHPCLVPFTLYT